jgi:transposase
MRSKEQQRATVLNGLLEGRYDAGAAAALMGLSSRQVRRLAEAYRRAGPRALVHGNRGRPPAHTLAAETRSQVVELASQAAYAGYNHTHLHEVLAEELGVLVSRRSVARILRSAGLRSPRRRRPRTHRQRRERSARTGMLVQVDASDHDWLEGRGPRLALVGAVDDATKEIVWAHFQAHEDSAGYLLLLRETVRRTGIPLAWYSDKHSSFKRNDKEPWTLAESAAGRREPTQVGRALEELGITLIPADSPQAKGRIERCWETLQDRLVKELRRAGAATCDQANAALHTYIPRYKARFALPPADAVTAYRRLPHRIDLDGVCSMHYVRVVANDNTVRIEERLVQIPPGPRRRSYAQCRVELQERLDGELLVLYEGGVIARQPRQSDLPIRARRRARGRELLAGPGTRTPPPAPPVDDVELPADVLAPLRTRHPWRTYGATTKKRTSA